MYRLPKSGITRFACYTLLNYMTLLTLSMNHCFHCMDRHLNWDSSYDSIADSRAGPRDGAYVHGLLMEGARWDVQMGIIMDSRLKDLFPPMPVINVRVWVNHFTACQIKSSIYLSWVIFKLRGNVFSLILFKSEWNVNSSLSLRIQSIPKLERNTKSV